MIVLRLAKKEALAYTQNCQLLEKETFCSLGIERQKEYVLPRLEQLQMGMDHVKEVLSRTENV